MAASILVRPVREDDFEAWLPLWDGYNAFYGRKGETALPTEITMTTWQRFFDPDEPVFSVVAETEGRLIGLANYLFHRGTTRISLTCYLQDLFTTESERGRGIGRSLIEAVYEAARSAGINRVYWHTHETNEAGRRLYDKVATHAGYILYASKV
jgi:GNAT superfamily N-acetyltransferase